MFTLTLSRSVRRTSLIVLALACCMASASSAHASGGTLSFHVKVSGKVIEFGGFSRSEKSAPGSNPALKLMFVGCAIIKEQGSPATYQLQVRTTGTYFAGMKPTQSGVYLTVDNFHPGSRTGTFAGMDVSGTFAINSHSYGDGATPPNRVAHVTDGGHRGAWTDAAAVRDYAAQFAGALRGFQFTAAWHCATIFHVTSS
jgi:hypothetical protein